MRRGFTLVETLVVAAIIIAVSVGGFLGLAGYRNKQALEAGLDEFRAAVEGTKRRSVAQEQGSRWGVRLTNATSGISSYAVFKGSSYSTSSVERTYSFRDPVGFANPTASSTYDVIFAPLTGVLSENKVVTLVGGSDSLIGDLILRTIGSITARIDQNVAGYWHFDEGTSTFAYDASGNANTGTLTNSPTWTSGSSCKAGQCLAFNGSTNYVEVSGFDLGETATLLAWMKSSAYGGKIPLSLDGANFSSGPNIYFSCNVINWNTGDGCTNSFPGSSYPDSGWHLIAVVNDSSSNIATLYMDGESVSTSTYKNSAVSNGIFRIGGWHGGGTYYFNGTIDEVRVYGRALSASEIEAHYNDLR